jgi:Ca2+-binding RTX toxin-like protein
MRRALTAIALAAPICLAVIVSARAAQAINDGGFEGTSTWSTANTATACKTSTCAGFGTPRTGNGWGLLGYNASDPNNSISINGQISQSVQIPSGPASLNFAARAIQGTSGVTGMLSVSIDGTVVKTIATSDPAYASYAFAGPINVSSAAGAGAHTLAFSYAAFAPAAQITPYFTIDDVSLTVPDPPSPTTTTSTTTTTTPTETTTTSTTTSTTTTVPQETNPPTCLGKTATITGTDATEIVTGSPNADVIVAGGGDDVVRAGAGNDIVCGGAGNDEIKGASGNDRLLGETGRDKLNGGGGGGDRCDGGPSRDKATQSCEKAKHL